MFEAPPCGRVMSSSFGCVLGNVHSMGFAALLV